MAVEIAERIGARMRERREELGLTQAEVARRMEGKTTSDQVSRWERGKHQPNDLGPIARVLEVDVSYFYSPQPDKQVTPDLMGASADDTLDIRLARIEQALADLTDAVRDQRIENTKALDDQTAILEIIKGILGAGLTQPGEDDAPARIVEAVRDAAARAGAVDEHVAQEAQRRRAQR